MKKLILLLLSILILFPSCDLMMEDNMPKPRMYLVVCGLGYEGLEGTALINPLNDAKAMSEQFGELCTRAGSDYEIVWYSDDYNLIPGATALTTDRFSFTHYNNSTDKSTGPRTLLYDDVMQDKAKVEPVTSEMLADHFFDRIESLWDTKPTENDIMIFYYSGHGVDSLSDENMAGPAPFYTADASHGYIAMNNYWTFNYDIISRHMDMYPSRQLFIIDCCYAGADYENPGDILYRNDNEFAYALCFTEAYEGRARNDLMTKFDCGLFIDKSMEATFSRNGRGKPARMVINASTYAQQSRNSDIQRSAEKGVEHYGGFTYRLLKYLGYNMTDDIKKDSAGFPEKFNNRVITASGMMHGVYNNISSWLREIATPNMTRTSYDMVIWDFRDK